MRTIAFFDNGGRSEGTTTAYHAVHMLAELGYKVLAVDLDPQAYLTSLFLSSEELSEIYEREFPKLTLLAALKPLGKAIEDVEPVTIHSISDKIGLLAGDPGLSVFEDEFSASWSKCLDGDKNALRVTTAFYRIIEEAYCRFQADFCLVRVGPNFGAINRAALIAINYVVVPVEPIIFSLQEIKNVGSCLAVWRSQWKKIRDKTPTSSLKLPNGLIEPIGYTVTKHGLGYSRLVESFYDWGYQMPQVFRKWVLKDSDVAANVYVESDAYCLALLKYFYSLMPMSLEARKPIFLLKPADGAIGAHGEAVKSAYDGFKKLAEKIIELTQTKNEMLSQ